MTMNYFYEFLKEPLNIFIIILLSLVLISCLGMYKEGFTSSSTTTPNGSTEQTNQIYLNGEEIVERRFTGPNGNSAEIISSGGNYVIIVTDASGNVSKYNYSTNTSSGSGTTSSSSSGTTSSSTSGTTTSSSSGSASPTSSGSSSPTTTTTTTSTTPTTTTSTSGTTTTTSPPSISENTVFYGPYGGTANVVKGSNGLYMIQLTNSNGQTSYYIQNTSSSSTSQPPPYYSSSQSSYQPPPPPPPPSYPNYSTYSSIQSPTSQQPYTYPLSQQPIQQSTINNQYNSTLPPGIPASQIPSGEEDLYILKSEVIPPVCPVCPEPIVTVKSKTDSCAPCPPCGRCPQPSFDCKKVPNYNSPNNDNILPSLIIPPYSTYGS